MITDLETKSFTDDLTRLYPLSDALRKDLEVVRRKLKSVAEIGLVVFEDSRGLQEVLSSVEAFFPSFTYPRFSARYRYESWNFKDSAARFNTPGVAAGNWRWRCRAEQLEKLFTGTANYLKELGALCGR